MHARPRADVLYSSGNNLEGGSLGVAAEHK